MLWHHVLSGFLRPLFPTPAAGDCKSPILGELETHLPTHLSPFLCFSRACQDWGAGGSSPGVTPRKASGAALFAVPSSPLGMSPMQALLPALAGARKVRSLTSYDLASSSDHPCLRVEFVSHQPLTHTGPPTKAPPHDPDYTLRQCVYKI